MRVRWLGGIALAIILTGCATSGRLIKTDLLAQIKEGVTTEAEVIRLLGAPQTKTLDSNGKTIMLYYYTKAKTRPSTLIPYVGLLTGGMDMRQQMLTILLDQHGIVEKYTLNDSETPINTGLLNTR
jgi:outer membrane protein assembly factor BamE (lipoprotein component of BamABCDE complex)